MSPAIFRKHNTNSPGGAFVDVDQTSDTRARRRSAWHCATSSR
jgi:hypothetical protein